MLRPLSISAVVALVALGSCLVVSSEAQERSRLRFRRQSARLQSNTSIDFPGGKPLPNPTGKPDLVILRLDPPSSPSTITIKNQGTVDANRYDVEVKVLERYGSVVYEIFIPRRKGLRSGQSATFPLYVGTRLSALQIRVDPKGRVGESNERNNTKHVGQVQ